LQDCPPDLVPPLYLPAAPPASPPSRAPEAPPPAGNASAGELVTIKSAKPETQSESTFAEPADLGEVFSEERAERLNKLNTLLDTLHERLRVSIPPLEFQDASATNPPGTTATATDAPGTAEAGTDAAAVSDPPAATEPPDQPVDPPQDAADPAASSSPPPLVQQPEPVSVTTPGDPPLTLPPHVASHPAAWISQTVVESPVDRLALADNLFAAGETTTALNLYVELDGQTLSDVDRHWVEMQMASCYRRIGDIEEASKYYRKLVNVKDPTWMSDMARWWLMVLDKRKSMVRQSSELDAVIQQLQEQVHAESRR
ncbi:MAG: hypothetical protein AB7Q45_06285, partial [Planctomycetaceae bacterium]